MNDPFVDLIFNELMKRDLDMTEKELRRFSKRCLNGCRIYIKSNDIIDEDDHILNLKVNYLLMKLDKKLIEKITMDDTIRVKDVLNTTIYETHPELKVEREELMSKVVDSNSYSCSLYTCPRCKKKEHTYREIQTRALDEPKSVKCLCLVCGQKFGIS